MTTSDLRDVSFPNRDVVGIGGSAGAIEAVVRIVRGLPASLPASILLTIHVPPYIRSSLPNILGRATSLGVGHARHDEKLVRGRIYIAPPDHHLLLHGETIALSRGPRENGHRPAIDPMFRSIAVAHGRRAVGVILSGLLDDGTAGIIELKRRGGVTIAQSVDDARHPSMPSSAITFGQPEHVAGAATIAEILTRLCTERPPGTSVLAQVPATAPLPVEAPGQDVPVERPPERVPLAATAVTDMGKTETQGPPAAFTCPQCHGTLWALHDGALVRYRCRVGHAFTEQALFAAQQEAVEEAMWTAYRTLEEAASMARRMAERARSHGIGSLAERYDQREVEVLGQANLIRRILEDNDEIAKPEER